MAVTEHAPGTFCWVELATTDAAAAKSLYSQLFGWDYVDNPMGPDMVYTMCQLGGKSAAALYEAHARTSLRTGVSTFGSRAPTMPRPEPRSWAETC
jgi:predicted enzyme related to lactoylglutathione lyase